MEASSFAFLVASLVLCVFLLECILRRRKSSAAVLPPGPVAWPLIGSIFSLRTPLHICFSELAAKYGPLMYFKLGASSLLVVNSKEMAREVLKVHDLQFAYRPLATFFKHVSFGYNDIVFSPYGEKWRKLKKLTIVHLFSPDGLKMSAPYRQEVASRIVHGIFQRCCSNPEQDVKVRNVAAEYSSKAMLLAMFGREQDEEITESLVVLVEDILHSAIYINLGELFPALDWLDLHRINRRMKNEFMPRMRSLLQQLLDQHRKSKDAGQPSSDFTDILLSLQGEDITDDALMGVLFDMIAGSVETTQITVEWAIAMLINHPEAQHKAQQELDAVVGHQALVDEQQLPKLTYIDAIFKETLRLCPPAAFGAPHYNPEEVKLAGYTIPARTKVLINIWGIGRDPKCWSRPNCFEPDRFIGSDLSLRGQSFELLPFGAGRRLCAGIGLSMRSVPFILATLLHAFEWSPPAGQPSVCLDAVQGLSATYRLVTPLLATATPRLPKHVYYAAAAAPPAS